MSTEEEKKTETEEVSRKAKKRAIKKHLKDRKNDMNLTFSLIKGGKWKKDQYLSFIDLGSLEGVVNSCIKILAIVLLVIVCKDDDKE